MLVVVVFCLGVVSLVFSGIGGGLFIVVKMVGGKEVVYDFREIVFFCVIEVMLF